MRLLPVDHPARTAAKPLGIASEGPPDWIGLRVPDARHHLHVQGVTGAGKSTWLARHVLAEAHAGGSPCWTARATSPTTSSTGFPTTVVDRLIILDPGEQHAPPGMGPDVAPQDAPDGAVRWADAVPWLALRWGTAPTAAEVRFAPVVWALLHQQPGSADTTGTATGRTVLQMAAEAELTGHTDLDPNTLTRVLVRYERAGVVRSVTDGRLARWSVLSPADVIAQAQESARAGGSSARTRRPGVGDGAVTPAGGLRGLVADHLVQHPAEEFSPTQVANALGRSYGAVANALERLVEHGAAVQTSTSPRRYQHYTGPAQDGAVPDGSDLDRKRRDGQPSPTPHRPDPARHRRRGARR
ncbi:MAG: hypothetical protein ACRDRK_16460 [Pseudonocardia sp.]